MLPAKRKTLMTTQTTLIKANNTLKTTQAALVKSTDTLSQTNTTLATKNTELTNNNEEFSIKRLSLITERDITIPARKVEINTFLTSVWAPYNTLKNEINTLKKDISKMPTIKESEAKIVVDTKAKTDAETAFTKAKTECQTESKKITGYEQSIKYIQKMDANIADKLAKMEAAKRGNTLLCSLVNGNIHLEDEEGSTTFK